jgi:PAS domain S-box-containing protein
VFRIKLSDRYPQRVATHRSAGYTALLFWALTFPVLYIVSRYNYNLFHGLADIFTIVIASTVFVVAWNSRESIDNSYLLYAGIGFLSFSFLDLFHVLSNKNMGVFPQYGNLGPTLYIASRYVLSISLVTAPLFINRKLRVAPVFAAYSLVTLLVLLSVFYWQNFPVCFVEGVGLTAFKVVSDYIICLILLGALILLLLSRRSFDARVLRLLAASILLSIATGLAFALYADPFGIMNAVGHFFQIISFYLIYLAVIETGLTQPQNILFRKLKQSEEKFRNLFNHAEVGMFRARLDGAEILDANESFLEILGLRREEVLGQPLMIGWADPHQRDEAARRLKANGRVVDFEYKMLNKNGETRDCITSLNAYPEEGILEGSTWDITDRKRAEEELRRQREWLRVTLSSIGDAVIATDKEGRITFLNPMAVALTGWQTEEALGNPVQRVFRIINEKTRQPAADLVGRVLREKRVVDLANDTALVSKNGLEIPIEDSAAPILEGDGNVIGTVLVFHDVTERRRAQEALRESEAKYRTLFQNMAEEVHFWQLVRDEDGQIKTWKLVDVNPPTLKTWGRSTVEEIRGKTTDEIFGPGATEHYLPVVQKIMTEGIPHSFEDYFPNLDKYFRFTSVPVGECFVTTGADITGIKKAEQALRESDQRFRLALRNAPVSVAAQDRNLRYTWAYNQRTARPDQIIGHTDAEIFTPEEVARTTPRKRRVMDEGVELREQMWFNRPTGRIYLDVCWEPIRDEAGRITGVASATVDLTPIRQVEEALQKAKDELELRVQERTEELKKSQERLQHLASQLLLAQEKERKRVAVELHDGLLSELAATKYLLESKISLLEKGQLTDPGDLKRVSDILATAMKEARRIMTNLHPAVLDELGLIAAVSWLSGEYQKSYPHIKVRKQIEVSEEEISDSARVVIFRVLQEALNNFAKHGKGDLVELSLSNLDGAFAFVIRDNGQGFDVENAQKGLGLESMRERVELSGGEFQIESIRGRGTTIRAIWRVEQ